MAPRRVRGRHCARPRQVPLDERSHKLATLRGGILHALRGRRAASSSITPDSQRFGGKGWMINGEKNRSAERAPLLADIVSVTNRGHHLAEGAPLPIPAVGSSRGQKEQVGGGGGDRPTPVVRVWSLDATWLLML